MTATHTFPADRKILINGLTLIALGLSIFLLDAWSNLFVKTFVGLFWGSFFLVVNGPALVRATRVLKRANVKQRTINRDFSSPERRTSGY
jgi:hypothetical protein